MVGVFAGLGALTAATLAGVVGVNALAGAAPHLLVRRGLLVQDVGRATPALVVPARHHKLRGIEPEATI